MLRTTLRLRAAGAERAWGSACVLQGGAVRGAGSGHLRVSHQLSVCGAGGPPQTRISSACGHVRFFSFVQTGFKGRGSQALQRVLASFLRVFSIVVELRSRGRDFGTCSLPGVPGKAGFQGSREMGACRGSEMNSKGSKMGSTGTGAVPS